MNIPRKAGRPDNWTREEQRILKQNYPSETNEKLKELLPDKTEYAIRNRVGKLKLKKKNRFWTPAEKKFLLRNIGKLSYQQIAVKLLKTREAVIGQYRRLIAPKDES